MKDGIEELLCHRHWFPTIRHIHCLSHTHTNTHPMRGRDCLCERQQLEKPDNNIRCNQRHQTKNHSRGCRLQEMNVSLTPCTRGSNLSACHLTHTHTQKTPASISRAVNERIKEKIRQNQIASECKQTNICICVQYLTEFRMRKMHIKCHFLMKAKHAKHAKQNVEFFYSIAWARAFNFHRFMPPSLFCSSLGSLILSLWGTAQQTHMNPPKWLFLYPISDTAVKLI